MDQARVPVFIEDEDEDDVSLVGGGDSRLERLAGIELFEALTQIGDRLADELLLLSDAGVRPCSRNGVDHPLFQLHGQRQQDVGGLAARVVQNHPVIFAWRLMTPYAFE
ncbi:hypothetical protein [Mycobacterium sp. PSTR-4-N]|uniref:hypothetical protein n=1 Tax=Mycobacterium sp. PSTR-4-N TaxID=2917745 RepID=UPI001F150F73|nr:hypothetical protein [Mycobacterium sp. PSTR-4-N]MCG7598050.1 hypothetical protein [Mycobacterium sp. PSTR-4-N]